MTDENSLKKLFKRSVHQQGGLAVSLTSMSNSGICDLYVIMPKFSPVLIEAKYSKEPVNRAKFSRKIKYTALQVDFMNNVNKVHDRSAFGLVFFHINGDTICSLLSPDITHINESYVKNPHVVVNKATQLFDVVSLFTQAGISSV